MPTYKIGPLSVQGESVYEARRPLVCERCHAVLGDVWAVAEYSHVAVERVLRKWPEMDVQVRRHEAVCQPEVAARECVCLGGDGSARAAVNSMPRRKTTPSQDGLAVPSITPARSRPSGDTAPLLLDDDTQLAEQRKAT